MMKRILIVEDDAGIAELERDYLELAGYEVHVASDGTEGFEKFKECEYNLCIFDVMVPGLDGFQLCKKIREMSEVPILLVTAKRDEHDAVRGLSMGADDYIMKPFRPAELVARVKSHLNRYERLSQISKPTETSEPNSLITVRDIWIDENAYTVHKRGEEIHLTQLEFNLLLYLAKNRGIVLSKEQMLEHVWGFQSTYDTATVPVHIKRLREKIEDNPSEPEYVETVWGVGYKFIKA